jgi:RNA polymerase-binding transcription factor DksA
MKRSPATLVRRWPIALREETIMTASFAYSPARASDLTDEQLEELNTELLTELRRLTPDSTLGARRHNVRTHSRVKLILDALKRMGAGVYGTCLRCQLPIAFDRLSVIPETKTCVRCS